MSTTATSPRAASVPAPNRFGRGVLTMLASGTSTQVGAALGANAFPAIGPAGVVAVRQFVAAVVLIPLARPNPRRFTWAQWWPTLALGGVFATMNLSLYAAIARVGLGLAVTLEFLGPLAVALLGSRSRRDLGCAVAGALGVYVLVLPGPASDYAGVAFGLVAAACWAGYIVLNRRLGRVLPGLQAPAAASGIAALIYTPVAAILVAQGRFTIAALAYAIVAGLLSSAVPYAADLAALRWVPQRLFGVFMSVNPALAAVAGLVILGQQPAAHEWLGIAVITTTNAVAVTSAVSGGRPVGRRRLRRSARGHRPDQPAQPAAGRELGSQAPASRTAGVVAR